jgi:hypothetical protein
MPIISAKRVVSMYRGNFQPGGRCGSKDSTVYDDRSFIAARVWMLERQPGYEKTARWLLPREAEESILTHCADEPEKRG